MKEGGIRVDVRLEDEDGLVRAWSSHIILEDGVYQLYFTAAFPPDLWLDGIYVATSTDGLNFTIQDEPIVRREKETLEDAPEDPCVVRMPDGLRVYYWIFNTGILSAVKR